jgi:hypothetical protein
MCRVVCSSERSATLLAGTFAAIWIGLIVAFLR